MSELSSNLALPFLQPGQAQKHVTHNEALERLDVLAQLGLEAFGSVTPPVAPAEGEAHGIGAGAGGAWAGQDGCIAAWLGQDWVFIDPAEGWRAWGRAEAELRAWDGAAWTPVTGDLSDLDGVGIGAAWDASNRLVVASEASLLTHAGAGHQLKVNKAASGDTGSLLFQTDWSGRAEMGLTGSDDFAVKVSGDGADWKTVLQGDAGSGIATAPHGIDSQQFTVDFESVASIATPSAGGFMIMSIVDNIYPQTLASGIFVYDTGSSPKLDAVWTGSNMDNLGTNDLTGTTGTAGNVSIAVKDDGKIYIENQYQTQGTRQFCITWLNGFRQI